MKQSTSGRVDDEASRADRERWKSLSSLQRMRYRLEFLALMPAYFLVRTLPERVAVRLCELVGVLAYHLLWRRRRIGRINLALAFPELPEKRRRRILRVSFRNFARSIAEYVKISALGDDEFRQRVTYADGTLERLPRDRGIIFFTGHIGNWELLAISHSMHGHPMHVVVKRLDNPLFNALASRYRSRGGNVVRERNRDQKGLHALTDHVSRKGALGVLVDQYARRRNSIVVPFFGHPARSHRGPALVAVRTGAALVPAFLRREEGRGLPRYVMRIGEPVLVDPDLRTREQVRALTEKMQRVIEEEIRSRPEDWFWVHRRWKRALDGESDPYSDSGRSRRHRRRDVDPHETPGGGDVVQGAVIASQR